MKDRREYSKVTFGRKLDVKRLQGALSRTMGEATRNPSPKAAPVRVESILIQTGETTVFLSGNRPGLDAVARALRKGFSDSTVSKATRDAARRPPRITAPSPKGTRKKSGKRSAR